LVETFSLRDTFDDVDHDDGASEGFFRNTLRGGRTNVASADHRDFVYHFFRGVVRSDSFKLSGRDVRINFGGASGLLRFVRI